jgi:haloacetate dehalogenase
MTIAGFAHSMVETNGTRLSVHRAGAGEPLVLLHGYPQNHMAWEKVAPTFAEHFDVIVPDLRGYGESDVPPNDADHRAYSKREMARDIVGLLDVLGLERAHVLGHDRGARVSYRLALDHPDRVRRLGIIEVVPTGDFWASWTADLALSAYHWTFLAQPAPLPERMISADAVGYIDWTLASWTHSGDLTPFSEAALASYRAQAAEPARVAAMCNDYRAGAGIDRNLDEADRLVGRRIAAPLHFIWAESGFPAKTGDPLACWEGWAETVSGTQIAGVGHFAMDEAPDAVTKAFLGHFSEG